MSRPGAAVPARRPWADLRDDSLDNLQDDSLPPPPLHEDSYVRQDTDLSIDAGSLAMQSTQAASQAASRMGSQQASFEMMTDSEFGFPVRSARELATSSAMNPDAQEFRPAHAQPSGQPGGELAPPAAVVLPVVLPVLPVVVEQAAAAPPAPEPPRRRITRKRQAAPGRGGTPSAARRRMDGIEEPPRCSPSASASSGARATGAAAASAAAPDGPAQEGLATEEDWLRRCSKRRDIIATIKASSDYTERGQAAPGTPDPDDRGISKRTWEDVIRGWRQGLRNSAQP